MEKSYYNLTPAQNLLIFSQTFSLHRQINNISTMLLIEGSIDLEVLKNAVLKTYKRMDNMRVRLTKRKGKSVQYFLDEEEPYMEDLDLSGKTQEEVDKYFGSLASKRVTYYNKPLSRIYFLKNCTGYNGIFLVVSHLILDSWGICVFYKDIMAVYEAMVNNKELPPPPVSYKELMLKDLEYKTSPKYVKDRDFWRKQFTKDNEPIFTHINGPEILDRARKKHKNPDYRSAGATGFFKPEATHEICIIPKETAEKMASFSREKRVPIQTLVMLGIRTYLSKANRMEKDITFYSSVARRGTLAEKNSGGTRVHFVPLRTVMSEEKTFVEALEEFTSKQNEAYRHSEYDPIEYFKLFTEQYKTRTAYSCCSTTFQPVPMYGPNGMKIHTKWYCNGTAGIQLYLTIMDDDGSGALRCYYEYQYKVISKEGIHRFHNGILKVIEAGLENENITLGELLALV